MGEHWSILVVHLKALLVLTINRLRLREPSLPLTSKKLLARSSDPLARQAKLAYIHLWLVYLHGPSGARSGFVGSFQAKVPLEFSSGVRLKSIVFLVLYKPHTGIERLRPYHDSARCLYNPQTLSRKWSLDFGVL